MATMNTLLTTDAPAALTAEQCEAWRRDGVLPLGRILDDATLEAVRAGEARFRRTPLRFDQDHPEARFVATTPGYFESFEVFCSWSGAGDRQHLP